MARSKAGNIKAAKKAARTRKRNAAAKAKKKHKTPKKAKGTKSDRGVQEKIVGFIKNNLKKEIQNDLQQHKISSEADLRSSVTYHIRNFIRAKRIDGWRLHTGLWIYPDAKTKKELRKSRVEIDVAVSRVVEGFKGLSRVIGIELKEHESVGNDKIVDLKKLTVLKKHKMIKYGFMIYLYRGETAERKENEAMLTVIPEKVIDRIFPIAINAYETVEPRLQNKFDMMWEKTRDLRPEKMTARKAARSRTKGKSGKKKNRGKRKSR